MFTVSVAAKCTLGTIHPLWGFLLFSCWIQSTKSCWELSTVLTFLRDALPIKIGIHYMVLTTGLGRANGHRLHVYQSIWFFSLPSRGIEPGSITWKSEMTLHHGGCKYSVNLNVYHVKILPLNHHFKIDRNLICLLFMFLCHLTFCHGAENHPRYQGCIYFWTTILWSRPFYRYMKPIVHLDCPMCWKAPMHGSVSIFEPSCDQSPCHPDIYETYFCSSCPMRSVEKHPWVSIFERAPWSIATPTWNLCSSWLPEALMGIYFWSPSLNYAPWRCVKIWNRSSVTHFWFTNIWITRAYNHIWNRICLLFIWGEVLTSTHAPLSIYFLIVTCPSCEAKYTLRWNKCLTYCIHIL